MYGLRFFTAQLNSSASGDAENADGRKHLARATEDDGEDPNFHTYSHSREARVSNRNRRNETAVRPIAVGWGISESVRTSGTNANGICSHRW
jgi:hypothetical protein